MRQQRTCTCRNGNRSRSSFVSCCQGLCCSYDNALLALAVHVEADRPDAVNDVIQRVRRRAPDPCRPPARGCLPCNSAFPGLRSVACTCESTNSRRSPSALQSRAFVAEKRSSKPGLSRGVMQGSARPWILETARHSRYGHNRSAWPRSSAAGCWRRRKTASRPDGARSDATIR